MKTKIFWCLLLTLCFAIEALPQTQSAASFVDAFYKFQRTRSGDFNGREIDAHERWFSAELVALLRNELKREKEFLKKNPTDKPFFGDGLTFEPLDECYKMGKFYRHLYKIGAPLKIGDRTIVPVGFSNPKVCGGDFIETYKLELIKTKGVWKINDLIYADERRLSGDLKRAEY